MSAVGDFGEFTPDELDAMAVHFAAAGPVRAASNYLEELVGTGSKPIAESAQTYGGLWSRTDPDLRFVRAQAFLWSNRGHKAIAPYVNDAVAESLAEEHPTHPLWPSFAETEIRELYGVWGETEIEFVGAASQTRVIAPDLELVLLVDTRAVPHRVDAPTLIHTVASWLMRHRDGQWRLASHSDRLPEPGWPPTTGPEGG